MAIGTLVAPDPWVAVPVGAVLSAVAAGACVALRIGPPREYFIVFTFLIATALPEDPGAAPGRAGLVLLGAAGAWVISMAGTLRDARAPRRGARGAAWAGGDRGRRWCRHARWRRAAAPCRRGRGAAGGRPGADRRGQPAAGPRLGARGRRLGRRRLGRARHSVAPA